LPSRLDINSVDRPITVLHAQVIDSSLTSVRPLCSSLRPTSRPAS
jgi:hypothetical protein